MCLNRRIAFVVVAIMLVAVSHLSLGYAGKPPGKGGGGGGTTPPFTLEITWLGRMSYDSSTAVDINNVGVVVGRVGNVGDARSPAFVWDPIHGMQELNDLAPISGYTLEWGHAINDDNVIAGWAWNIEASHWEVFRVQYDPISPAAVVEIIPDSVYSYGNLGLNEAGDVAFLGQAPGEVIVVKADGSRDTVYAPRPATSVEGINDSGEIVVRYDGGSYRYTPGDSPVWLDFPADSYSAINQFGSLCGYYTKKKRGLSTDDYAVRFQDGQGRLEFGPLTSYANGINSFGDVCGTFKEPNSPQGWDGFLFTSNSSGEWFLWNVGNLIANGSDAKWNSSSHIRVRGINDDRQTCGNVDYRYADYEETGVLGEAFILTPVMQ